MDKVIDLGFVYGSTYFGIITELEDGTFKGKILDSDEKIFYEPNIIFSYYDICLQNLRDRLLELARREAEEVTNQ